MLDGLPSQDKLFLKSNKSGRTPLPATLPRINSKHQERLVSRRRSTSVVSSDLTDEPEYTYCLLEPLSIRHFKDSFLFQPGKYLGEKSCSRESLED